MDGNEEKEITQSVAKGYPIIEEGGDEELDLSTNISLKINNPFTFVFPNFLHQGPR